MKSRPSTLMSRLALALLALAGFVAPAAERELDGVVQTSRANRSAPVSPAIVQSERVIEAQVLPAPVLDGSEAAPPAPFTGSSARRYLLNRAWLL